MNLTKENIFIHNKIISLWLRVETAIHNIRESALAIERAATLLCDEVLTEDDIELTPGSITINNVVNPHRITSLLPVHEIGKEYYDATVMSGIRSVSYRTKFEGVNITVVINCDVPTAESIVNAITD